MSAVRLDPVTWDDGEDLIDANRKSAALHHPWVRPCIDRDGFAAWFRQVQSGRMVALLAREAGSGTVAGVVTLSEITAGAFQNACLGYYANALTVRRGLMTQALRQACRFGFEALALHRLEANIQPANAASIALARRVGFRLEGLSKDYLFVNGAWRDHERWALLTQEPHST